MAEAQGLGLATHIDENPIGSRPFDSRAKLPIATRTRIRAAKRLQAGMIERETDAILLEESIEQHAINAQPQSGRSC